MAEIPDIFNPIMNIAQSKNYMGWLDLGINFLISTLVTGILLALIVFIFSKKWTESVKPQNAILLVLVVNVINFFGILGILYSSVSFLPGLIIFLPLLVWIGLTKAFFSGMGWIHAAILGVVAYLVSIFVSPYMIAYVRPFIPM